MSLDNKYFMLYKDQSDQYQNPEEEEGSMNIEVEKKFKITIGQFTKISSSAAVKTYFLLTKSKVVDFYGKDFSKSIISMLFLAKSDS